MGGGCYRVKFIKNSVISILYVVRRVCEMSKIINDSKYYYCISSNERTCSKERLARMNAYVITVTYLKNAYVRKNALSPLSTFHVNAKNNQYFPCTDPNVGRSCAVMHMLYHYIPCVARRIIISRAYLVSHSKIYLFCFQSNKRPLQKNALLKWTSYWQAFWK